jgi:hypothetical protein
MPNLRLVVLIAVCLGLGALAWLDNRSQSEPEATQDQLAQSAENESSPDPSPAPEGTGDSDVGEGDIQTDMDASQYMTPPDEPSISNPLSAIEITSLRDTVERPLFASSRRRPPESAAKTADAAAAPAKAPTFELLGVALGGPRAIAILRTKSDGKSYRVQAGDILAGWQVSKVESHAVVLERPEGLSQNVPLLRQ